MDYVIPSNFYEFGLGWYRGIDFRNEANLLLDVINQSKKENDIQIIMQKHRLQRFQVFPSFYALQPHFSGNRQGMYCPLSRVPLRQHSGCYISSAGFRLPFSSRRRSRRKKMRSGIHKGRYASARHEKFRQTNPAPKRKTGEKPLRFLRVHFCYKRINTYRQKTQTKN